MSDVTFSHDFVFQYAAFRHHSFFFSHEFGLELFEPYQPGGIPLNLQDDRTRRMEIDRLGNYVVSLLKARCRVMTLDASTFEYVIPPYMEDDMYLTASAQRPWIHGFRSSFIGQRRSHNVMIIDVDAPSEIAWILCE
ncbi:hypothetical protein AK812_SmicGene20033 [Symbiodinium microadriaticum]|uniref:Uncharacterized protein n=1 Tax=Symbiodinium microadriaticum TaxID=2951 RepID=A0A1Q9DR10_SYMMI|nr:hypothetical protein AK812_SmicGene20033 [Symbiodinium microadriaticum]